MKTHWLLKLLAVGLVSASVSGCAVVRFFSSAPPQGATFAQELPPPVSVAWRDGVGNVWIVPKRGVLIEQIHSNASPAAWATQGAYVVVQGKPTNKPEKLFLLADKYWWPLVVPEKAL